MDKALLKRIGKAVLRSILVFFVFALVTSVSRSALHYAKVRLRHFATNCEIPALRMTHSGMRPRDSTLRMTQPM